MATFLNRRHVLTAGTALVGALAAGSLWRSSSNALDAGVEAGSPDVDFGDQYEVELSPAQWREILSENQFLVLREEQTERPYTSPLNDESRVGTFHCAGCDLPAYASQAKYDSGTGWPSFYEALDDAVRTKDDNTLFVARIEVHCRRCKGHFGHIFDDGPAPTGMRHCLNGLALRFQPVA